MNAECSYCDQVSLSNIKLKLKLVLCDLASSNFLCFQLTLALRYLHKDKGIVHRDLTPNNIMLGENDKVTISKYNTVKKACLERPLKRPPKMWSLKTVLF